MFFFFLIVIISPIYFMLFLNTEFIASLTMIIIDFILVIIMRFGSLARG